MASHRQSNVDFPYYGESIERLSVTTLTHMELDALNMLEESIGYIETKETQKPKFGKTFQEKLEHLECNDLFQSSEAQTVGPQKDSSFRLNAGYIIFDGAEMTYVLKDECLEKLPEPTPEQECNSQSRDSSLTHVSDLPSYLNISHVDLLGRNGLNSTVSRVSLTPYKRLPQYAHFSFVQKFYLFAIGVAPILAINAFYMSVAFFLPVLGKQVLSRIGICHNVPFLAAMLWIYCGNKHWVPFLPTVPICLVVMAASVTVIPSLAAAQLVVPLFAIYGIVTLNGLCAGLSQSLTSRIVVLFPGGRSGTLISCGAWFGSLLPVVVQMILVLTLDLNSHHSAELADHSTLFLYALFGVVFAGISTGLVSLIRLSRSGIYELFAGRDCAAHSPKNITLGSVPETTTRRYHNIKWHLFSEFAFSLVSYYVFSLAPIAHEATLESLHSNSAPFWRVYLATVFVALFRCGDVFGRALAALCCYGRKPQTKATKFFYLIISVFRIGFVVAAVFYIREPFFVYSNLFMMAMYFTLAFTSGFFSVAMASSCQSMIRVQPNDTCPIVSQLFLLSEQMGVTIGIALSFVQFTV